MTIFGKNAVLEALKNDEVSVNKVLVLDSLRNSFLEEVKKFARKKNISIKFVPRHAFAKYEGCAHQGIVAEVVDFKYSEPDEIFKFAVEKNEELFLVVCDEIEDPHNLGAIIRTAECAGCHGVIITKNRSAQVTDAVIKTSAGAAFNIKVARVVNLASFLEKIKKQGVFVFGLDADGKQIYNSNLTGKIAIVVGSEGCGLRMLTKKMCDEILSIKMFGKINSLNASNAAAIGIYEAVRQRSGKN